MATNYFDPGMEKTPSLSILGLAGIEIDISAADAERLLQTQQSLRDDGLRGDENDLIASNSGALAHVVNVGLLVPRSRLSVEDPTLMNPVFNANLVSYDQDGPLDSRDMLSGTSMWDEPIGTCFMIGNGTILTARHVFSPPNNLHLLRGFVYAVFGHSTQPNREPKRSFTVNQDVFQVLSPGSIQTGGGIEQDWIKLRLHDPENVLASRSPANVTSPSDAQGGVYTLGHPNGLTLRYSRSRTIEPGLPGERNTFRAFLDAYPIASGSPVFNFENDSLIGIVLAGDLGSGRAQVTGEQRFVSRACVPPQDESNVASLCLARDAFP